MNQPTQILSSCLKRLVRRYKTDEWPNASDGLEIDVGSGKIRIGIYARHLDQFPTFFSNYALQSDWNIRIGRLGIAFQSSLMNTPAQDNNNNQNETE
jgi:hypothetical protein